MICEHMTGRLHSTHLMSTIVWREIVMYPKSIFQTKTKTLIKLVNLQENVWEKKTQERNWGPAEWMTTSVCVYPPLLWTDVQAGNELRWSSALIWWQSRHTRKQDGVPDSHLYPILLPRWPQWFSLPCNNVCRTVDLKSWFRCFAAGGKGQICR